MLNEIYRCYVEKKKDFDVAAKSVESELSDFLRLPNVKIRLLNRYDVQGLSVNHRHAVLNTVLCEPVCDVYYEGTPPAFPDGAFTLCVEALPGQFDVRADSCEQCIQMLLGGQRPIVKTALVYVIEGITDEDFQKVKSYLINPVECREAVPEKPDTLVKNDGEPPGDVKVIPGFTDMELHRRETLRKNMGLAMSTEDLETVREYFKSRRRNPSVTELRILDTYWSDHCRHTTFNTVIESADIRDSRVKAAYERFLSVNGDRPVTLMGIAVAAARYFRESGGLPMLDVSEENNACTIRVDAKFKDRHEDWLLFFKNETHNHPTEIEPYGGAATCIGGAIRDPLSGRAYVYQSMRITGAGEPRSPIEDTLPGKLPQRKLTVTAAHGFSSYGNQIGLATGYVKELYHPGYIAKRLETGAVVGAAPACSVRRSAPVPGDVVILLGGRTGRDGIGGATGSSKTHGVSSVLECASEVQKGNPPEERKLQRLFCEPKVAALIKRCNDFGAGGAAVAIGELADGVEIFLDEFPVKYTGLDGTELAISESQERMAVVVDSCDVELIKRYAQAENIEATVAATVTEHGKLTMVWNGKKIADIDRAFLDTNGAVRKASVVVPAAGSCPKVPGSAAVGVVEKLKLLAGDLSSCSQKGLVERFDSSIGAGSVFMPYGGKYALSGTQVMAALLPAPGAVTASVMAYGFEPGYTEADPFGGSVYAVVSSVAKLIAAGVALDTVHLSLQEYFPRLNDDALRWGKPFSAVLGAFSAQMGLNVAAIGGKDSMSGSFGDLDVPSTLISFAVGVADADRLINSEFSEVKRAGNPVYLLKTPLTADNLPDYDALTAQWGKYAELCGAGKVLSARVCEGGGVCGCIMNMSFGNAVGFVGEGDFDALWDYDGLCGSIVFEARGEVDGFCLLGYTKVEPVLTFGGGSVDINELLEIWESPLEGVFPVKAEQPGGTPPVISDERRVLPRPSVKITAAKPKAVIPVFPGTNCEYDTVRAIERAGGVAEIALVRNLNPHVLEESVAELEKAIETAQIIVFPGGFSGGDEPDGSGKYIVSLFRNQRLSEAVHNLIQNRDGLILGICNGFQALIKLGLLPYGNIAQTDADSPTLTFNRIGRHQSRYVAARVSSVNSPWLSKCSVNEIYHQPVSHGEGRFTADKNTLDALRANGQIVFQYSDYEGLPSMDIKHNPNGSVWAIEGVCSPDGRILGKMAHTERYGEYVAQNVPGNKFLPLFEGGIDYFK